MWINIGIFFVGIVAGFIISFFATWNAKIDLEVEVAQKNRAIKFLKDELKKREV